MDIRKLQRAIIDGLEDVKAQHIAVFNTEHLTPLFERVIVASGTSNRQTKALAASVRDRVKSRGMQVLRTEGEDNGEWIIVDCGAAVAHIMQPAIREYYHLEEIWGGKTVKLKLAAGKPSAAARAASSVTPDDGDGAGRPAPKKAAAKTAAKTAARKSARTVAKKAAAGKAAAPGQAVPRKTPAKAHAKAAPRAAAKAPARQAAAPKAPARKAAVKKPAAAAKKAPARRSPGAR